MKAIEPLNLGLQNPVAIGHLQTVLGHILPSPKSQAPEEVVPIQFSQGANDFGCMHFSSPRNPLPFVFVLFHGLAGHSDSDYMRRLAAVALRLNCRVVRMDHRGSGFVVSQFTEPYHSGRSQDISDVIKFVRKKYHDHKVVTCGISMSGTILLNLLTNKFGDEKPDFAITVNAPLDLADAAQRLKKGVSRLYDIRFYYRLKKLIEQNHLDFKLPPFGTTELIDDLYTAKKSGFHNRQDYYARCSPLESVAKIDRPCYVVTAKDDPFVSYEHYKKAQWPTSVNLIASDFGGHVGYISKTQIKTETSDFGRRWLDYCIFEVLQKIINDQAQLNSL